MHVVGPEVSWALPLLHINIPCLHIYHTPHTLIHYNFLFLFCKGDPPLNFSSYSTLCPSSAAVCPPCMETISQSWLEDIFNNERAQVGRMHTAQFSLGLSKMSKWNPIKLGWMRNFSWSKKNFHNKYFWAEKINVIRVVGLFGLLGWLWGSGDGMLKLYWW